MLKLRTLHNKNQAVWLVEPGVKVGRSASNDLILDDPGIADRQLVIAVKGEQLVLQNRAPQTPVEVNGEAITGRHALKETDRIRVAGIELELVDPKKMLVNAPVESSGWSLKANNAALTGRVFPLQAVTVVGRSTECDICLAVAHLSRRHAQLEVLNGLLYVKDLGSANGTFLNGKPIREARIRRGDELRFDTLSFGVLGPADELDKTTVRRSKPVVKSSPGRSANSAPRRAQPVRPAPSSSGDHSPVPMRSEASARPRWLPWLLPLALIIAVGTLFLVS